MAPWQRKARLFVAVGGIAFAIAVAFAFRGRVGLGTGQPFTAPDPKSIVEGEGGTARRFNRGKEEVLLSWKRIVTYQDASSKMFGVSVVTERSGRVFTITGDEATVGDNGASYMLTGHVNAKASDGLTFRTDRATYNENDGRVVAPGRSEFARGRMSGSSVGLIYDKNHDSALFESQVSVHIEPEKPGAGRMELTAKRAELSRPDHVIRFEQGLKAVRAAQTMEADAAVAYLSMDDERLDRVELRGNSRITGSDAAAGALQSMTGRDINLKYAPDGQTLQQAEIIADAVVQIAGAAGQAGRRITSNILTIALAPDGATPTSVTGRERVELLLPGEPGGLDRTIRAQSLDATGEPGRGLTSARFTGSVQFEERGGDIARGARSGVLVVALSPGLGSIEEAQFSRAVRFVDGAMTATAANARYLLAKDVLELTGSEPALPAPRVENKELTVNADRIDVTLEGPVLRAAGNVRSEVRPASTPDGAKKLPSMLKGDRPVIITAAGLEVDSREGKAVYTGTAQRPVVLNQGETTIKAPRLTIDEKKGDLSAAGPVVTTFTLERVADGKTERVPSTAAAEEFSYEDAQRRATYTGKAHMNGPDGDLVANKIELYLKESGDELERIEAFENVQLRDETNTFSGKRLTHMSAAGISVLTGTPVVATDNCGRRTEALKLTYDRGTGRMTVETGDGQPRTQGAGRTQCP